MQTYFRIQAAHRDTTDLLDEGCQFSHPYNGGPARVGVSTCETLDDLAFYLAFPDSAAITFREGEWVIVELEGDLLGPGLDDHFNEMLIRPTRIVAITPVDDEFIAQVDLISAQFDTAPDFDY